MRAEHVRNHVLRDLVQADRLAYARLSDQFQPLSIERGTVLSSAQSPAEWVYFVECGAISLVASTIGGQSVEVALIGREGVAGLVDALGNATVPYGLVVQLPGLAFRAPRDVIRAHVLTCTTLHSLLMDCAQRLVHQLTQSVLCGRFHSSVQRLARWLLLTAQRAETNRFELTHESVAQMVGAPRSAVSEAAATLRQAGIIDYRRGVLTIRNMRRLQTVSCECYHAVAGADAQP